MSDFRIVTTPAALGHLEEISNWCRDHGVHMGQLEKALERALGLVSHHPGIGSMMRDEPGVFRLRLKGTKFQMYFRVDQGRREVHVIAFWHTSRGERPPLPRPP